MTADADNGKSENTGFDYRDFVARYEGATTIRYSRHDTVYAQGDPADAAFYIINGSVKVTVISEHGKEGVLGLLKDGDFFGEECLHPHRRRNSTITSSTDCGIVRLDRETIAHALGDDIDFAHVFMSYILDQNDKLREGLIDQLFNSSERRLARILLALANAGLNHQSSEIAIPVTQETLASMVGTTRPRISQFMTKFRKLGYIDYDDRIRVHHSLVKVITEDDSDAAKC